MKHVLLQIGKHSSIYMISQIVTNSLSVLMLPLYLHYFSTQEFGSMALIDLTVGLFAAALGSGLIGAIARFHFEEKAPEARHTVWWTGLGLIVGTMTVGSGLMLLLADPLARNLLGPEVTQGPLWFRLAAISMWIDLQIFVVSAHLRAEKRSMAIVMQTVARVLIFVACATTGIMVWKLGLTAMFVSNLVSSGALLLYQYACIVPTWGRPRFSRKLLTSLVQFGGPLLVIGVLMIVMNSLNQWFVRSLLSISEVGLMSLGIQVAEKVNRLIVMPFQQIWGMLFYELHAEQSDKAVRTFCFVFELFCYTLISVFFGCSIVAGPALMIIAKPEYLSSVPLIPILCLARLCFAVSDHFLGPVRISKQTYLSLPAAIAGIVMACTMNSWLIPLLGVAGAAWATLATYATYSSANLFIARQVAVYPYPFARIGGVLAGVCATFVGYTLLEGRLNSQWLSLGAGLALWFCWTLAMAAIAYWRYRELSADEAPGELDPAAPLMEAAN